MLGEAQRKQALRERARRLSIPAAQDRSREVQARVLALPEIQVAETLAYYSPLRPEPLTGLLPGELEGRRLCIPATGSDELVFRESSGADLVPGPFRGLFEPPPSQPKIPVEQIDLFVIPGLSFDRRGIRLGRGKGYYDRALALARSDAVMVGVCFAECFVEMLPSEEQDVPMHVIVTDRALHRVIR